MAGAEPGEIMEVGVILYVDPNATMVYNSDARVNPGYSAEELYGAGMTISEYMIRLRECGVGHMELQFESYATPADGLLSSEVFGGCISQVAVSYTHLTLPTKRIV